jgi:hypothetical protein
LTESDSVGTAAPASPRKRRPGNRWGSGIPRRRKTTEPWQILVLRGLLPVLAVLAFLGLALVLSVLTYDATGSVTLSLVVAAAALVTAAFLGQRVVARILESFS